MAPRVLVAVMLLALLAGCVGSAAPAAIPSFHVTYAETVALVMHGRYAPVNTVSDKTTETVRTHNATHAVAEIQIYLNGTRPTVNHLNLTIAPANGTPFSQTFELPAGTVPTNLVGTTEFRLGTVPSAENVTAGSADEALARAARNHTTSAGVGDWKMSVVLENAPGPTATVVLVLRLPLTAYDAKVTRQSTPT